MTKWQPDIENSGVEHYKAIVEAMGRDIASGALKPGERLPPHRELAHALGLAVGTVSKAYMEARRRGFIHSRAGSGTFVREHPLRERRRVRTDREDTGRIDLSFNGPVNAALHSEALQAALTKVAASETMAPFLQYHRPWLGHDRHRSAGSTWIEQFGLKTDMADVAVVSGAQHAASVALIATATAGDLVVTDELCDPSIRLLAGALGLNLRGLKADEHGLLPEAFENACQTEKVKAIICMPDHHSPTLVVMPEQRRRAIAEIARAHGVTLIENAVYRPFLEAAPPPIASFAPEISYYCTSLSKIIAPGLRIGFLTAPSGKADELVLGMGATSWMTPPLIAEVATQWIEDGTARRLVDWQRTELAERNRMAAEILDGFTCSALKSGLHIWLQLPDRWRAATLAQEARARDVLVTPADAFAIGWVNAPHAVRISLGGATGREALVAGLRIIVEILGRKVESSYLAI